MIESIPDRNEILAFAVQLSKDAGLIVKEARRNDELDVGYKEQIELVTSADIAVDELICSSLKAKYPGHFILSEESSPGSAESEILGGPTWIIDPIDGTDLIDGIDPIDPIDKTSYILHYILHYIIHYILHYSGVVPPMPPCQHRRRHSSLLLTADANTSLPLLLPPTPPMLPTPPTLPLPPMPGGRSPSGKGFIFLSKHVKAQFYHLILLP